jgi:RNA polymerase sigma-70 factor (ECF subfamily)
LTEQNPALWELALIREAEGLLHLAASHGRPGRYQLEAAVQSAHLEGRRTGHVDWAVIEQLYAGLFELTASPVAALNQAVALSNTAGAAAGLAGLDALHAELRDYQPYWAARAELLGRCGRPDEARQACERAIALESDAAVREFLSRRAAAWATQ